MASPSSVPKIQFTAAGLVIPAETDILAGVQADMNAAFGGGLNPGLETPQGQLASSQAAIIGDKNNEVALIVNQVDPQYAADRFQDAIARIYFLTRKPATPTSVQATVNGLAGTVIPGGTLAQDTSGNTYACAGAVTIDGTGSVTAEFQNVATGPIPCAAGTLTQVYQAVPGWDTITNASDGTLGSDVESRADFEYRRKNSVALNGIGTPQAIYAEVFALADVLDVYVKDNPTGAAVNTGATNYPIAAHSVYVAVVGGADADVAAAIWAKKDLGCDTNGNASATVVDPSGYTFVHYQVPAAGVPGRKVCGSTGQRPQPAVEYRNAGEECHYCPLQRGGRHDPGAHRGDHPCQPVLWRRRVRSVERVPYQRAYWHVDAHIKPDCGRH